MNFKGCSLYKIKRKRDLYNKLGFNKDKILLLMLESLSI